MSVPALRFKDDNGMEFPDWNNYSLGAIASFIKDGTHGTHTEASDSQYYLLSAKNINNGRIAFDDSDRKISKEEFDGIYRNYKLEDEDILLTVVGTIGRVAKYSPKFKNVAFQRSVAFFRFPKENSDFMLQIFTARNFQNALLKNQVVSAQPGIYLGDLAKINVSIPSVNEQTKIANFLTAVDEKITQITQKHDLLSQYKKGVMQQIFSQELRFKEDDGGDFPEWEEKLASDVFVNVANKNHDGELPILAATQDKGMIYREDSGLDIKSSEASIKSYKIVEKGDFVISLRSFQGGIEYSNVMGICSPAYTVMKPKIAINDGFFKAYLKKEDFIESLNSLVIGIRDGKQISYSAFATLTIPYPSIKEQTKIANFLTAIDDKITATQAQLDAVKQYKQGLLQQMFV